MTRRTPVRGAVLVAALAAFAAWPARAQDTMPHAAASMFTVIAGAGGAFAGSQNGMDRDAGPVLVAGLELGQPWRPGFLGRVALRVEGDYTSQGLSSSDNFVRGDVKTLHGAALVSVALVERGRFASYAVAGPVWSRVSTKLVFDAPTNQTPGAGFEETTHETVPGVALGIGAGWRVRAVDVRLEARWMSMSTRTQATTIVPVILSVAVPLHR